MGSVRSMSAHRSQTPHSTSTWRWSQPTMKQHPHHFLQPAPLTLTVPPPLQRLQSTCSREFLRIKGRRQGSLDKTAGMLVKQKSGSYWKALHARQVIVVSFLLALTILNGWCCTSCKKRLWIVHKLFSCTQFFFVLFMVS